jgi:two-component system sensor histidine kinase DesK
MTSTSPQPFEPVRDGLPTSLETVSAGVARGADEELPLGTWSDPTLAPNERGRRWGWLFALVWLFFLANPLSAIHDHPAGAVQVLGYVALAAFAITYVAVLAWGRTMRPRWRASAPLSQRWGAVVLLLGLGLLTVPAAGPHGLATMVYVSATAMMLLPLRWAWTLVGVLLLSVEGSAFLFDGWRNEASGDGLGVMLAALAVMGLRLAADRNSQLLIARDEVARLAVSAERERMARDMHDILGHSLTVITVKAELAGRLLEIDPERAGAEIADLERLSREALSDVRATLSGYREVNLARELANARSALTAAGIDADLPGALDDVPGERRELFGWAVREGVTNVVRHSGARHCWVRLDRDHVEVVDDGRGVADCPDGDEPLERTPGHGLSGLGERARQAGATITVGQGDGGRGFRLRLDASGAR